MKKVSNNNKVINLLNSNYALGFEMLFAEFYNPMVRVASKFIDNHLVEDIVQDIFISIWKNRPQFNSEIHLKSYLFSAVKNSCLKELNRNKLNNKYKDSLTIEDALYIDNAILDEDIYTQMMNEIEKLPEHYRIAIEQSFSGESISNIAKMMNTSIDSIKAYKRRAKERLRLLFKDDVLQLVFSFFR